MIDKLMKTKKTSDELTIEKIEEVKATKEYEWELTDEGYFIVKLLEYVLLSIDDRGVQRIIRDVENYQLSLVLKGLSMEAQNVVYKNLSKRLAVMICEDMEFMGPVSTRDVAGTAQDVMVIIVRLMSMGEIPDNDYQIVSRMTKVFGINEHKISRSEEAIIESDLEKLFKQYKSVKNRMID